EDAFGRGCLTGIDVGHDADIADLVQVGEHVKCHGVSLSIDDLLDSPGCRPTASRTTSADRSAEKAITSGSGRRPCWIPRSEEHTSEIQSRFDLVCRILLQKIK